LALDAQTDIVTTQRIVSDIEIKKQQEQFGVLVAVDGNNFLNVGIDNQGQNPVEISSLWIINKTLPDQPATRYSINYDDAFIPAGFTSNVISTQTLEIAPDTYDIKTISSLGTIKTVELVVGAGSSSGGLRAELITDPPDVVIGKNVTVAMIVTNTGEGLIQDVQPEMQPLGGSGMVIDSSSHTPPSVNLERGESVMFSWDYQVTGNSGADLIFSAIARGDYMDIDDVYSNVVSDVSVLRVAGEGGEAEEIVLKDELFGKPQIFMIMPNAVGDEDTNEFDRPIWGVNIANPTDQDMYVTKVVITSMSPRDTGNDKVFAKNCETINNKAEKPITIFPTPDRWSCIASNQIMWKDVTDPQLVEPRSVFPFLVAVGSDNMGSSVDDTINVLIQPIVFTTLGQFSKASYGTTMHSSDVAIPNVFLARNPNSVNHADIMGELRAITEGTTVIFNATIADMSDDNQYGINSGSRLIINIPKDWTFNGPICPACYSGFDTPTAITFSDG